MSADPLLSIIHASARPMEWRDCYQRWIDARTGTWPIEYLLVIDDAMKSHFQDIPDVVKVVINQNCECCVDAYNAGAKVSTGDVLILQSDDMYPPHGWDESLRLALPDYPRVRDFVVHCETWEPSRIDWQVLSRARYERLGYALYPEFESMSADCEFTQHAQHEGVVIDAKHIRIEHRHPHIYRDVKWDACYEKENAPARHEIGARVLTRRIAQGFPVTCEDYYRLSLAQKTDIVEHLPILREFANGKRVLELGVRHGHSTCAFLAGHPKLLVSVDHSRFEYADGLELPANRETEWRRLRQDSRISVGEFDVILFDTVHNAQHLREEIAAHEPHCSQTLMFHDVESCGTTGEDGGPGIMEPIRELLSHGQWEVERHLKNNNGLMILKRIGGTRAS